MKHLLFLLALLACGDEIIDVGPIPIGGSWSYNESLTATSIGMICSTAGTFTIAQREATFAGTFMANNYNVCDDLIGGTLPLFPETQQVTGGQIDGATVSFRTPFCQYDGTVSSSFSNIMSGPETCTVDVRGQSVVLSGWWQAFR